MEWPHVVMVTVANGGYIVQGRVRVAEPVETDSQYTDELCVYSTVETLLEGIRRVVVPWEGSGELIPGSKLGPLKVAE